MTTKTVFEETVKAVRIIQQLEEEAVRELPNEARLKMVKEEKKATKSRHEFEELDALEKELAQMIKFPEREVLTFQGDTKEKVTANYEVEREEAAEAFKKKYAELGKIAERFGQELQNTLQTLEQMERDKAVALYLEQILNGDVEKNPGGEASPRLYLSNLERSTAASYLHKARKESEEFTKNLKKLADRKGAGIK